MADRSLWESRKKDLVARLVSGARAISEYFRVVTLDPDPDLDDLLCQLSVKYSLMFQKTFSLALAGSASRKGVIPFTECVAPL